MMSRAATSLTGSVQHRDAGELRAAARGEGVDLAEILSALRRRWRWILAIAALSIVAGMATVLLTAPKYAATVDLVVDPRGLQVTDKDVVPGIQTSETGTALIETQIQVLTSDAVLRRVAERHHLDRDPEFNGTPRTAIGRLVAAARAALSPVRRPADPLLLPVATLRLRTRAVRAAGSFVVTLSVSTREPRKSAALAQSIVDVFTDVQAQARQDAARRVGDALAARLGELRDRVDAAESAIERFKRQNGIVGANGRLINEDQLADLSGKLLTARARTNELKARVDQAAAMLRSGGTTEATSEALQSPTVSQLRARYVEAKRLADDLAMRMGPRHPELLAARVQLQGIAEQIAAEVRRIASAARNDYERARTNEATLQKEYDALTSRAGVVNADLVKLRELEREAQASRAIYESFLARTRETREQQDIDSSNIRVISPAVPPVRPDGLPSFVLLVAATAVGLSLGAAAALARDRLDDTIHSARRLAGATGLSVLAEIPLPGASDDPSVVGRLLKQRPQSRATRAAHRLLGYLTGTTEAGQRVILVTSPDDRVGKSTIALDLALAAGLSGERALLVDADDDGLVLTRALAGPRLTIAGRTGGETVRLVGPVHLLPASPGAAIPILERKRLPGADPAIRTIVFDGGLANEDPGLPVLADIATDIVLVLRAGTSSFEALDQVRHNLGIHAGKVVGAVLITRDPEERAWPTAPQPAPGTTELAGRRAGT